MVALPYVGKPVQVVIPCAGLDPGSTVKVSVFEPHAMGGDPVETFDATVDDLGGLAKATWTYDHSKHKDTVTRAYFILVAEGGGRSSASRPIEFVDSFQAAVKDANGNPAANRAVILHADRGQNVQAQTDDAGNIKVDVPPGNYHVELCGPVPPDQVILSPRSAPVDPDAPELAAPQTAGAPAAVPAAGSGAPDPSPPTATAWTAVWSAPTAQDGATVQMLLTAPGLAAGCQVSFEVTQDSIGSLGTVTASAQDGKAQADWSDWFHGELAVDAVDGSTFKPATFSFKASTPDNSAPTTTPLTYADHLNVTVVDETGAPRANTPLQIASPWGTVDVTTSDAGVIELDLPPGGAHIVMD